MKSATTIKQHGSIEPCCSVLIPVSNDVPGLRKLLSSLTRQSRSATQFEVIVCDDGSTEPIRPSISEYQSAIPNLRCLRQDNLGQAAARNMGIIHSQSDVVIFLDSNIELDLNCIERLLQTLDENPSWSGASARIVVQPNSSLPFGKKNESNGIEFNLAAIAYRVRDLRAVGGLDEHFRNSSRQGIDLARRALLLGEIGRVSSAIAFCDRSNNSLAECWESRNEWRYQLLLAERKKSDNTWRSKFPRLNTVTAAALSGPKRTFRTLQELGPIGLPKAVVLGALDFVGGLLVLPNIILGEVPPQQTYLAPGQSRRESVAVSKAS